MSFKNLFFALLSASAIFLIGCGNTSPVLNYDGTPVVTASGKQSKLQDVKKAIITAGNIKGWQTQPVSDGHIVASIFIKGHMAKVDIKYTAESFSITYKDSSNLNYDGTNIHKRYNHWIRLLNDQIRAQVSNL